MTGSCIIDGMDINDFGMFILKGGDNDFLPFPERKKPAQNDWFEEGGLDVDLTEVYFKEKKLNVKFHIKADAGAEFKSRLNNFHSLISAPGYRSLYSREFNKTFSLRYISCPEYNHAGGLFKTGTKRGDLTVEFSMDDPLQLFTNPELLVPIGSGNNQQVSVNGYDLSRFGIIVTGCYDTVLKPNAVKTPLVRNIERRTGLIASTPIKSSYQAKQLQIDCTMIAPSRDDFYYNYEALFNNLTLPVPIEVMAGMESRLCYYQNMVSFEKLRPFKYRSMVRFSLQLMQIK